MLERLREIVAMGGPASILANEILVLREKYETSELTVEEYQFLMTRIADVRAEQELSNEKQLCNYIISAARALSMVI